MQPEHGKKSTLLLYSLPDLRLLQGKQHLFLLIFTYLLIFITSFSPYIDIALSKICEHTHIATIN